MVEKTIFVANIVSPSSSSVAVAYDAAAAAPAGGRLDTPRLLLLHSSMIWWGWGWDWDGDRLHLKYSQ